MLIAVIYLVKTNYLRHIALLSAILLLTVLSGCSPKKNNAATRNYQAFITRYNIYFNGDEHFKETLKKMEDSYEDDYSALLPTHPAETKGSEGNTQSSGDFTRSIEKAQKAIQLRSIKKRPKRKAGKSNDPEYKAWLKRDEYNPFIHNAWMMMARSQYYNGDFLGAASTFYYISRHFTWLPKTVTEAQIWQARSYISLDWLYEGEGILKRVKTDELANNTLKGLYYLTYSDYYIKSHDYEKAVPMLVEAVKYADGTQKTRLTFLLGQIYARIGDKAKAYAAFAKAGSSSGASYRTKFNARIKQSEVYEGTDIEPEVKALRRMTRYDRNADYLDQIYYAIGNLYLSRADTTKAIENYSLALEKSKRQGIDKAIAGLTLGGLYFDLHRYDKAQECYSQAMTQINEEYPDYKQLKRRSDVLDELAVYAQNVTLQDSLLRLAAMSPEEQLVIVNKIIDDLKKKEKEEAENAKREEYLANQQANGTGLNQGANNAPATFVQNTDKSWYFYNTATRNAGKTEFQKRWGSRKLEDDWRRRNKAAFSFSDFDRSETENNDNGESDPTEEMTGETTEENAEEKERQEHEQDPHFPEYYLRQIPADSMQIANSNDVIQEGLYNMGVILKDKLEDFDAAGSEFNTLLSRYPDNIYRLDTYYNLYLMAVRSGNNAEAERLRMLIVNDFPESPYGMAMKDPRYFDNLRDMEARQETLYEQAYDDYLNNRNESVHEAYRNMQSDFPMSKIMPKFMFLHALAYVTDNKPDEFNATLREMLERYPETDLTPLASAYLKGMAQGRKLHAGLSNARGMIWSMRLTNDSTAVAGEEQPIEFDLSPDQPQQLVLLFPTDSVNANTLLYDIARHNFSTFVVRDFDLELMNFGTLGMLIIKPFANQAELDHYRKMLNSDTELRLPEQVMPVMISTKNFEALLKSGASFEQYLEAVGDTSYKQAQKAAGIEPEPSKKSESSEKSNTSENSESSESPENSESSDIPETSNNPEIPEGSEGDDPLFE